MTASGRAIEPAAARARLATGVYGPLPARRWLAVTGADAGRHLHAMLTRDLADLPAGGLRYAALVDDRAHYLADAWVLRPDGAWWLDAAAAVADRLRERLTLFAVSSDAAVHDAAAGHDLFHWEGATAPAVAAALGIPVSGQAGESGRSGSAAWNGRHLLWADRSHFGAPGVTCLVPKEAAPAFDAALQAAAESAGLHPLAADLATRLRIEAGRPLGGVDVGEEHLLPEAGLWGAVSLDKGCFPGQEILQRVARQGRLQRRLTGVRGTGRWGDAASGARLTDADGQPRGVITSWAAGSGEEETVGLAWVRRAEDHAGRTWQVAGPSGVHPCHLVEPPFVALAAGRLVDAITPEPAVSRDAAES